MLPQCVGGGDVMYGDVWYMMLCRWLRDVMACHVV